MWEENILQELIKKYFEECKQSEIQIDNFNHTIEYKLKKIIEDELINIKIDEDTYFRIYFDNVVLEKPYVDRRS